MKNFKLMALCMLTCGILTGFHATAQNNDFEKQSNRIRESAGPKIEFDKLEHNYGSLTEGDNGEAVFSFTNTGEEPLIITKVHGCCGVTVLDWTKEPLVPNTTGFVKLRYFTSRIGTINKVVTVSTNDPENPVIQLKLRGEVRKKSEE